jgi:putative nucleotidyltransferase with HDIG domain
MFSDGPRPTPPRFVTRTLIATLATVAFVLSAVLLLVTLSVRDHVRRSVVERLETGQRLLDTLEQRRLEDLRRQAGTLAESSTLKAALDTYRAERRTTSPEVRSQLVATVGRELDKLAARLEADVVAARDPDGEVIAVSGRRGQTFTAEHQLAGDEAADAAFLTLPSGVFRAVTIRVTLQEADLGSVQLAQALDEHYATELSTLSGAQTLIVSSNRILATTLPPATVAALTPQALATLAAGSLTTLGREEYAVQPLLREGHTAVYVLNSIDVSARPLVRSSLQAIATIGAGAFVLAALASLWLARTISRPIGTLSGSLTEMTRTRAFDQPLPPSGGSLEVDSLTEAFNTMMASITAAEAETLSAYLEAIRALAMALDARDPYTSGHSERVSALSVAIGREMRLSDTTLEVLRLGALLHDIGKIGISDHLLRKPAPLTADEYEVIKKHPTVGSRILKNVRFLEPHLPIVELHHERPDGGGYPLGLTGKRIPLLARIVHVADAYDAMTSARAYRPALPASTGLAELHRCAGTDFDPDVVRAFATVMARGDVPVVEAGSSLDAFAEEPAGGQPRASGPATPDALDEFSSEVEAV